MRFPPYFFPYTPSPGMQERKLAGPDFTIPGENDNLPQSTVPLGKPTNPMSISEAQLVELVSLRQCHHRNPELSVEESCTAKIILDFFEGLAFTSRSLYSSLLDLSMMQGLRQSRHHEKWVWSDHSLQATGDCDIVTLRIC